MIRLLNLFEATHEGHQNPTLTIELHHEQVRQLEEHARRNGVTVEQMAEEVINAFLSADTGSASHD